MNKTSSPFFYAKIVFKVLNDLLDVGELEHKGISVEKYKLV